MSEESGPRRSSRTAAKQPAPLDTIFVRADALGTAQWSRLGLPPRTGWVRGTVNARQAQGAASAPLLDVVLRVGCEDAAIVDAHVPLATWIGVGPQLSWSLTEPSGIFAHSLAELDAAEASADEAVVAGLLEAHCPPGTIGSVKELFDQLHDAAQHRDVFALMRCGEKGLQGVLEKAAGDGAAWTSTGGQWKKRRSAEALNAGQRALIQRSQAPLDGVNDDLQIHVCGLRDLIRDGVTYSAVPVVQRLEQAMALLLHELLNLEHRAREETASPLLATMRPAATPFRAGRDAHRRNLLESQWKLQDHPQPMGAWLVRGAEVQPAEPRDSRFEPKGSPVVQLLRCQIKGQRGCKLNSQQAVAFKTDASAVLRELIASTDSDARALRLLIKQVGQVSDMSFAHARKLHERVAVAKLRADSLEASLRVGQLRQDAAEGVAVVEAEARAFLFAADGDGTSPPSLGAIAARVLGLNPTSVLWRVLVATGFPSRSRQGQRAARPTSKRGRKRRAVRAHQLAVQAPHAKERRGGATADGGTGAGAGEAAGAGQGSGDELDSGEELDDGFDSATEGDVSDGEEKSDGEESDGDGSRGAAQGFGFGGAWAGRSRRRRRAAISSFSRVFALVDQLGDASLADTLEALAEAVQGGGSDDDSDDDYVDAEAQGAEHTSGEEAAGKEGSDSEGSAGGEAVRAMDDDYEAEAALSDREEAVGQDADDEVAARLLASLAAGGDVQVQVRPPPHHSPRPSCPLGRRSAPRTLPRTCSPHSPLTIRCAHVPRPSHRHVSGRRRVTRRHLVGVRKWRHARHLVGTRHCWRPR